MASSYSESEPVLVSRLAKAGFEKAESDKILESVKSLKQLAFDTLQYLIAFGLLEARKRSDTGECQELEAAGFCKFLHPRSLQKPAASSS